MNNTGTLTFDTLGNVIEPTSTPWSSATPVTVGTTILDSNGNLEQVTSVSGTGTTGAAAPAWNAALGGTTTDNTGANQVVWTNLGVVTPVGSPITGCQG